VILNLGVDHIDRHGSVAAYHAAKKNLLANLTSADVFVYNADDATLSAWASETQAQCLGFSVHSDQADAHYADNILMLAGQPLLTTDELHVYGQHQHSNALAVALVGLASGLSRADIATGLVNFEGVAGRYSHIAAVNGVQFVEDSIATRTLAVQAALEATPSPIVWLAGGQDKGADLAPLRALVQDKVSLLVAIGEAGPSFARAFEDVTQVHVTNDKDGLSALIQACAIGYDHLNTQSQNTQSQNTQLKHEAIKGTVLLAPLAASFDQFPDYQARARAFRSAVQELAVKHRGSAEASQTSSVSTSELASGATSAYSDDARATTSHLSEEPSWTVS
jgi:UDP-N-acetylmuramoylalanine--D-glutamate ligase